jgi:hypothetical protein
MLTPVEMTISSFAAAQPHSAAQASKTAKNFFISILSSIAVAKYLPLTQKNETLGRTHSRQEYRAERKSAGFPIVGKPAHPFSCASERSVRGKTCVHAKMCKSPDLRSEKGSPFSRPCLPSHGKPQ